MKVLRSHTNKSHMEKDFPTWISQLRTQPKSNQTIILLVYKPNPFNCSGLILQCLLWVSPLNHNSCKQGNRIAIATYSLPFLQYLYIISGYSFTKDYKSLISFSVPVNNCLSPCHLSYTFAFGLPPHFCAFSLLVQQRIPNHMLSS